MTLIIERKEPAATHARAAPEAISIALLNNMPDGALRSTEQQFARLLNAASRGLEIRLRLYQIPELPRSAWARADLLGAYRTIDELLGERVDGLIVTGCEPRAPTMMQEPFWRSLSQVIDWADESALSAIWSCFAAHAAVLRFDGIERHAFDTKLSGVFECHKRVDHELVRDVPLRWKVPHSRQYGLKAQDLLEHGYIPITESAAAGVDIFVKRRGSLHVMFQGHLEYDSDSLLREYVRDINRFLNGERDSYPELPVGLVRPETQARFSDLRARAAVSPSPHLMSMAPLSQARAELVNDWWSTAVSVYRRWLMWIANEKAAKSRDVSRASTQSTSYGASHAHG